MAKTFEEYRNDELNNIHIEAEKSGETLYCTPLTGL